MNLEKKIRLDIENKKILLSVCRFIERKGIHWFVGKVVPLLIEEYKDFIYVIVGGGPMRKKIKDIIQEKKLSNWVKLLGKVDNEFLKIAYNVTDIFIIPNIPVKGDLEGFGMVALEAASCKLPIVASNLEGIKDALLDGKIGSLIPPLDREGFTKEILGLLADDKLRERNGEKARELIRENFMWSKITEKYLDVFKNVKCG